MSIYRQNIYSHDKEPPDGHRGSIFYDLIYLFWLYTTNWAKHHRNLQSRNKLSRLPSKKTFAEFDISIQPSVDERPINDLATMRFVEHQENLIFLGLPSRG